MNWSPKPNHPSQDRTAANAAEECLAMLSLAAEASGYRTALAESPRGPDYMRHRHQRMELFIVPALQWLACLAIGVVLAIDAWRRRLRESNQSNQEPAE